jgi:hypothetical protein
MSKKRNFWTDEQLAFLVVCRTKKQSWEQIANSMQEKFGFWRSPANIGSKYRSLFDGDHAKEYTPQQSKFIIDCYLNHFQTKVILDGYFEQFGQNIKESDIDDVVKKHLATEKKVDAEIKTIKTKIKERKNMKRNAWTKEEDEQLLACGSWKEAMELQNGRSRTAKNNRWALLQKRRKEQKKGAKRGRMTKAELEMIRNCKTVEEALALNLRKPETIIRQFTTFNSKKKEVVLAVEPKPKKERKQYAPRWTKEEDYDLILNFYELSIDEARNRFNRSYGAIATRLEKLVDSTKPEHISMLMEASKEIKSRKKAQNPTPKKSRRTLRKERKKAKKEAKLKAKLQKIRGE